MSNERVLKDQYEYERCITNIGRRFNVSRRMQT